MCKHKIYDLLEFLKDINKKEKPLYKLKTEKKIKIMKNISLLIRKYRSFTGHLLVPNIKYFNIGEIFLEKHLIWCWIISMGMLSGQLRACKDAIADQIQIVHDNGIS